MSVYFSRLNKRGRLLPPLAPADFLDYLPFAPSSQEAARLGNAEVLAFHFGAALDTLIKRTAGRVIAFQGYGRPDIERRIADQISPAHPVRAEDFPESFCTIVLEPNRIVAFSSITGADQLFIHESPEAVYVTNRHNLLAPFLRTATFNANAFKWIAGRTHIGDFSFYWNEVKRSQPSWKYVFEPGSSRSIEPVTDGMFDPISNEDCISYVDETAKYFKDILSNIGAKKRLWLSGGKDSRAILGLLDYAGETKNLSLNTGGELFAPDVMAATELVNYMGLSTQHVIGRPALVTSSINFAERIAADLAADFTGGSLADLRNIARADVMIIGGHENGFKSPANTKDLESYLDNRRYWVDNSKILAKEDFEEVYTAHRAALLKALCKAPRNRYSQVDLVNFRNPMFIASALTGSHVGASELHPFLDGHMYRLLCGVSEEVLNSQFIHYLMMRKSSRAIEGVPFAADNWPESLYLLALKTGVPFRSKRSNPYTFKEQFPSQKSFGLYDWRIELVLASRDFTRNYLSENCGFFSFLNFDTLHEITSIPREELKFKDIYSALGLFKMALVHHLGLDMLNFSKRKEMAARIQDILGSEASGKPQKNETDQLKDKLFLYEKSIADLVTDQREKSAPGTDSLNQLADAVAQTLYRDEKNHADMYLVMTKFGFSQIPEAGTPILFLKNAGADERVFVASGSVIHAEDKNNVVLVHFSSKSPEVCPRGFTKSPKGFFYKYLPRSRLSPCFEITVDVTESGKEPLDDVLISIMPWYAGIPVFCRDLLCQVA